MEQHKANRWARTAKEEDWPQDMRVWPISNPIHTGDWGLKDLATGEIFDTEEKLQELSHRNHRYRMD